MRKRWWGLGLATLPVAGLYAASFLNVGGGVAAGPYTSGPAGKVWNIAHQGGEGLWPSNTMHAFSRAVRLGVDMLETDLHATRDGHLVTIHDASVNRTTEGRGLVKDLTLAEVRSLDAGYRWTNDGGKTFPFRGKGVRIAALDDLLAAFPNTFMTLEIKQDDPPVADKLCAALKRSGHLDKVLVASFKDGALREFRRICPGVRTSMAEGEAREVVLLSLAGLGGLARPAGDALQVPTSASGLPVVTPRLLSDARRKNVAVQVWTINDEAEMRRLVALGVNGIVTDRPDLLKRVLSGRGP